MLANVNWSKILKVMSYIKVMAELIKLMLKRYFFHTNFIYCYFKTGIKKIKNMN